ncbi:hypothetical protein [Ruegeria arenilitoris]|uniref:hypothetical protein n=1 Tax=Ruegeria arenilitoris TaxID=1173585 RepID=UPI00147D96D6|nr:hypothetical protein [Ruegeria arenilitoris]
MKIILTISVLFLSASALLGQDIALEDGQKLFTYGWEDQRVRTSDFEAVLSFEGQDDQPTYRIELSEPVTGILTAHTFQQEPGQLELTAFNRVNYCGKDVIFLTVRYSPPRFADIRQFRFETHAFYVDTLLHLDSAPVAFEAIALQEIGFDIGWHYIAPQPYQVKCETSPKGFALKFVGSTEIP